MNPGPKELNFLHQWTRKECQNIQSIGTVPCYATLKHAIGSEVNRCERFGFFTVTANGRPLADRRQKSRTCCHARVPLWPIGVFQPKSLEM